MKNLAAPEWGGVALVDMLVMNAAAKDETAVGLACQHKCGGMSLHPPD